MPKNHTKELFAVALCAVAFPSAFAQGATAAPTAPAPTFEYRSAFEGYRSFESGEVQDWRKANDTVREIGGWRAYAREIQAGSKPVGAESQTPQAQPKAADPHQGHSK